MSKPAQALFLGAGASVDAGMPLVTELTAELRRWLASRKLENFNAGWRACGGGWTDDTIATVNTLLCTRELHYEQIIGAIEVEFSGERSAQVRQELHAVHGFLLQAVRGLLLERQIRNLTFALSVLDDFRFLRKIAEHNKPLWVFTTNHDVNVELLAAKLAIPVKAGFRERLSIQINAGPGCSRQIHFERLARTSMNAGDYEFFKSGEFGINLVKLHGSLDIFGQNDELNYLKIVSADGRPHSYVEQLEALQSIDLELGKRHRVRATNEHSYLDSKGDIQFLRNSILSGAHKFSPQMSQIAPPEFLSLFRGSLNYASELVCIGYGFTDQHINGPIGEWLSHSADRHLTVVNPGIAGCPTPFGHLFRQVSIVSQGARQYFLDLDDARDTTITRMFIRQLQISNRKKRMQELLGDDRTTGA